MVLTAQLKGSKADIRIVDFISEWSESSSRTVRAIVDELINGGATHADVYINSKGGDIFEAVEIANELERFATIAIRIGSVAASAATYIVCKFKQYTSAKKNTQLMIHMPSAYLSGTVATFPSRLKVLENTTNDYRETYATATGKTTDEIENLWKVGDYWMTATEALEQGFIAKVEDDEQEITAQDVAVLTACGAPNIPDIKNSHKNSNEMEREKLIKIYGLDADATDAQIEAAARESKTKADQHEAAENARREAAKLKGIALVAQAILDKKITADMKASYEKFAATDYEGCKAIFDTMEGVPKPEFKGGNAPSKEEVTARASWTLQDYLDKAPDALVALEKEDKARFDRLNAEYFAAK